MFRQRSLSLPLLLLVVCISSTKAAIQFEIPDVSVIVSGSQVATGYLDITVHVDSVDLPKSVSSLNVDLFTATALSFGPAEAAPSPLLSGSVINFSGSAQTVRAGIDVFPDSDPLFDGAGLVRIPFQIPSGTSGVFPIQFGQFNELTDVNATPLAIQTTDVGSVTVTVAITGDYNHNGIVDAADYVVWRDSLGSTTLLAADGDLNGSIGPGDFAVWRSHFGNQGGPMGSHFAVPEPSSLILLSMVIFSRGFKTRNRRATVSGR